MKNLFLKLKNFFGSNAPQFQRLLEKSLKHILSIVTTAGLDILSQVAAQQVAELNGAKEMSNDEKRQAALNALQMAAVNEGIKVTSSLLNLVLETAVNAAKKP